MGLFAKLMIAILIIGGLAPFTFLKDKNGEPLMSFSNIKGPQLPDIDLPDLSSDDEKAADKPLSYSEGTVFKWKDKDGVWQFTSEPPPKEQQFSSVKYDQNMNVIQSVETKRTKEKEMLANSNENKPQGVGDLGSTYSPEKIEQLFDDANNLENLLNDRMKQQDDILKNL